MLLSLIAWAAVAVALLVGPQPSVGQAIAPAWMFVRQAGAAVQGQHPEARHRQQSDGVDGAGAITAVGGVSGLGSSLSPAAETLATEGASESINLADPEVGAFSRTTNSFGQAAPDGEGYTYGGFNPASILGEMAGARAVRTIDTSSGDTIGWQYETYDNAGNVRIIRPQWGDVPGPHFYYDANGNFTGAG